ncbi:MAG: tRNA (guanosine(37)-N1)-methyltransferase TrmD [Woeseiaceae bacterium]|nr:tRNA (guanosine(37)-N1)-methyltransferase TrmD [Woeseiaceae bacterium]
MRIAVVSLLPELVSEVLRHGVVGRAADRGIVSLALTNPREYADDVHRTVDDRPYGGGPGMVMTYEPLARAIDAARQALPQGSPVICLTPAGRLFDQPTARRYAGLPGMLLVAGRYEGIDERLIASRVDEELSLGDFVLSGGEIAAMAVIDAVTRLLPGVLGDADSAGQDSFEDGLLEYPQYTRPERIAGQSVPDVLLSGDHAAIARWRLKQALGRSYERRPDLIDRLELDREQQALLDEYLKESDREQ